MQQDLSQIKVVCAVLPQKAANGVYADGQGGDLVIPLRRQLTGGNVPDISKLLLTQSPKKANKTSEFEQGPW